MLNTIFKELINLLRDRFGRYQQSVELEKSVQGRFLRLFEEHGIHRNQIPSTFDHGLTFQDVATPEKLLCRLDDELLEDASELFGVSLEWLVGATDQIFSVHYYYKNLEGFSDFVAELKLKNNYCEAEVYLSTDGSWDDDAVLLIRTSLGEPYSDEIYRNYICGGWTHVYGKCRADLVACIAILLNQNIMVRVHWVKGSVAAFAQGNEFPSVLRSLKRDKRVISTLSESTRAENLVTDPNHYEYLLDEGNFGKRSAIYRWLDHYEKGYLDFGGRTDIAEVSDLFSKRYRELGGKLLAQD